MDLIQAVVSPHLAGSKSQTVAFLPVPSVKTAVESILDGIVGATLELFVLRNARPLIPQSLLFLQNDLVLLRRPRCLADRWVEVIHPPLAALLAGEAPRGGHHLRNSRPPWHVERSHQRAQLIVLDFAPHRMMLRRREAIGRNRGL